MTAQTCETCRFYGGREWDHDGYGGGKQVSYCNRYPRRAETSTADWCGEYQPRKEVMPDETASERRFSPAHDESPGVTAGAAGVVQVCSICDIEGCKHLRGKAVPAPTANHAAALGIGSGGKWIAKISPDGVVTFNPDLRPDGAGVAAWEAFMAFARAHNCGGISGGGDE